MTQVEWAALVRNYTHTNSTTLPDAELMLLGNPVLEDLAGKMMDKNEDLFLMPFYRDLEADTREYAMPDEKMQVKYVEAILDGTNRKRLVETDMNSTGIPQDEASIRLYYADRQPSFDIVRNSLFILSGDAIVAVTNGLLLRAIIYPAKLTSLAGTTDMSVDPSTTTFGVPRAFHELWARRTSIIWKGNRPKPVPLSAHELNYTNDLKDALDQLGHGNLDRVIDLGRSTDTGENY